MIAQGDLDVCNGQLDPTFGYRYHTSETFPYIIQCIVGEMDDLNSVPTIGMANAEGQRRPAGGPVDVENLIFRNDGTGAGYMAYEYEGESYFIEVSPTENESCFVFSWNIIGNDRNPGTAVESSEYCHIVRTGEMGGGMGMGMGMGDAD